MDGKKQAALLSSAAFFVFLERVLLRKYNHGTYFYRKDAQGNIIALLDSSGNVVVKYVYDAWGNHAVLDANGADITDVNHIGVLNPFRYRGYYYDTETELYYLQTRYYDPETGRFITIDGIEYLDPETINGLNLYAYCGNNPVMNVDPYGNIPNGLDSSYSNITTILDSLGALAVTFIKGLLINSQRPDLLQLLSKFSNAAEGASKILGAIGVVISTGVNIVNNIKSGASWQRVVSDAIFDVGLGIGIIGATAAVGGIIGSIVPGLGNFVGVIAGLIVGTVVYIFQDVIEDIRNVFYNAFQWVVGIFS